MVINYRGGAAGEHQAVCPSSTAVIRGGGAAAMLALQFDLLTVGHNIEHV